LVEWHDFLKIQYSLNRKEKRAGQRGIKEEEI
jgi:hypothetical protein